MKKLLLSAVNAKYIHSSPAVWYLKAAVKDLPIETTVFEWRINANIDEYIAKVVKEAPDYISFSCYIWNIGYITKAAAEIKRYLPLTKMIFGGPEITFRAAEFLKENSYADYCIMGEGETPLVKLLQGEMDHPGIVYRKGNIVISSPLEFPKTWPAFPMEEYCEALGNRISYYESSRGCPFSCAFCLSGIDEPVRFKDFEKTKEDICKLASSGAKIIKFVDRTFNCNKKRAYELLSYLIQNSGIDFPEDVRFHFEVGADLFDDQTLNLLAKAPAGLFQVEAGLQSFNEETLKTVQRKTDMDKLCKNLKKLISMNTVHVHIDLIAGLPFEDINSFRDSFNKAFAFRPHMLQLGFLKLLHGSALRNDSEKYGYVYHKEAPYEFISNYWMGEKEREEIHTAEEGLERMYNSHRFLWTIEYLLSVTDISPYRLFLQAGALCKTTEGNIGLDEYTSLVYEHFAKDKNVDSKKLRDVMAKDRLSSNNTGRLPDCLRVFDQRLKGLSQRYSKMKGAKVGTTILYSENALQVFCADYSKKDALWNRWQSSTEEYITPEEK